MDNILIEETKETVAEPVAGTPIPASEKAPVEEKPKKKRGRPRKEIVGPSEKPSKKKTGKEPKKEIQQFLLDEFSSLPPNNLTKTVIESVEEKSKNKPAKKAVVTRPKHKCKDCKWHAGMETERGRECVNPYKEWKRKDKRFKPDSTLACISFEKGKISSEEEIFLIKKQNETLKSRIEDLASRYNVSFWDFEPDMVSVPKKTTLSTSSQNDDYFCTACGFRLRSGTPDISDYRFCPSCGAKIC